MESQEEPSEILPLQDSKKVIYLQQMVATELIKHLISHNRFPHVIKSDQNNIFYTWWIRSLGRAPQGLCWVSQGQSNSRTASLLRGYVVLVSSLSHVWLFATPWTAAHQASLSSTTSQGLLKLMSTESVIPSKHCILCHPLLFLPSTFPSIRVFSNDLALHVRWPMY